MGTKHKKFDEDSGMPVGKAEETWTFDKLDHKVVVNVKGLDFFANQKLKEIVEKFLETGEDPETIVLNEYQDFIGMKKTEGKAEWQIIKADFKEMKYNVRPYYKVTDFKILSTETNIHGAHDKVKIELAKHILFKGR